MKHKLSITLLMILVSLFLYYLGSCNLDLLVLIISLLVGVLFLFASTKQEKEIENLCSMLDEQKRN